MTRLQRMTATALLLLHGCVGTETGNPPAALVVRSSAPEAVTIGEGTGTIVVQSAWVSIEAVHAVEGPACDRVDVGSPGRGRAVDLVTGPFFEGPELVEVCGFHLAFGPAVDLPPGAPDDIGEHAVVVRGQRADGSAFEAQIAPSSVDVLASAPFTLPEGRTVLLAFDAARWFQDVDLAGAVADPDGTTRIRDERLSAFEGGFAASVSAYEDTDADGVLDAEELATGPVAMGHGL